jgi:5-hydroxyisourate hydrolase-like protein (transthyretin family)/protocatechuate 3,4-dioxygenase beta subunit
VTADYTGAALPGIDVTLVQLDAAGEDIIDVWWTETDGNGDYLFSELEPGDYMLMFEDADGEYLPETFDDHGWSDEGDVIVVSTTAVTGVDAALATAGRISGTVSAADDGVTEGVWVTAWLYDSEWEDWMPLGAGVVESDGSYCVGGLPTGTYRLEFWDPEGRYAPLFFENAATLDAATNIAVTAGVTSSDRDVVLSTAAHITGSVNDADGTGIPYAEVSAWSYDNDYMEWEEIAWAEADENGIYDIGGLSAGTYRISARDADGDYVQRFFPSASRAEDGISIILSASETRSGVTFALPRASHIGGTVTADVGGAALDSIEVAAYAYDVDWEDWRPVAWDSTSDDGTYRIGGLEGGTYRIEFWDTSEEYAGEFYDDIKTDVYSAMDVTVAAESVRSGVNAALTRRGGISGTTTSKLLGTPVSGVEVTLYSWDGSEWLGWDTATADASGRFEFPRLYAGDYRVGFNDPEEVFSDQYYDQKATLSAATTVAVADGTTTTITARLIGSKGAITGVVRDVQSASALPGISVTLYSAFDVGHALASTTTGANGAYLFENITAGTYVIKFSDSHGVYASQFYPANVYQEDLACRVTVTDDVLTTANTSLRRAGRISGKVVSTVTGLPLSGITVQAGYMLSPTSPLPLLPTAITAADGTYSLSGLYPGTYHVVFSDPARVWGMQTYNGITPQETMEFYVGTNITVTSGITTANINGSLRARLGINGTLTAEGESVSVDANVCLYKLGSTGWVSQGVVSNGVDGTFNFDSLSAGTYRLGFIAGPNSGLASEYYSGWPTLDGATNIVLTDRPVTVNCDLGRSCGIQGLVRVDENGHGLGGAKINLYRFNRQTAKWQVTASTTTEIDGLFWFEGLLQGEYRAEIVCPAGYQNEFFNDSDRLETSTPIILESGQNTPVSCWVGAVPTPVRLSGDTRYTTALAVAKNTFPGWTGVTDVIISSGEDRSTPDPLSAAGLAWTYRAPLLLVRGTSVPDQVADAINAMPDGVRLHIVGGTSAVSADCERMLRSIPGVVETTRTAGVNRYATAAAVAREMKRVRGNEMAEFALVANGANPKSFVDALSLSPLSAAKGAPILLVSADAIPVDTQAVLNELRPKKVYVAGGTAVVSERVRLQLAAERWSGPDRYATAAAISREAVSRGWLSYSIIGITASLPDALAGGCTVGLDGGVMLLTMKDSLPSATSTVLHDARLSVDKCRVFGGPAVISDATIARIRDALR